MTTAETNARLKTAWTHPDAVVLKDARYLFERGAISLSQLLTIAETTLRIRP